MANFLDIKKNEEAFSYLRVSGAGQLNKGGFSRQRKAIKYFVEKYKIKLEEEFADDVSGKKGILDRPSLNNLLNKTEKSGIKLVLVEHIDRIARDLITQELILKEFEKNGVRIISCENEMDVTCGDDPDPTKKMIRQILGAIAEFEKSRMVSRLRNARERKRKEYGRCEGSKPFGFFEKEKETLNRIKQLARKPRLRKRRGFSEIAAILNSEGMINRAGREWSRQSVYAILKRIKKGPWTPTSQKKQKEVCVKC
jgi:DNA invertase Pin-like site-specific DNA recombinase